MMDWQPTASVDMLRRRAEMMHRIREFFARRGVTEVDTPILTAAGVTDVHIESIATHDPPSWLRTSPEYFHKRLLAAGHGDLFEIGPVFRHGEVGRNHQPEFTLLEWYRLETGWRELATEVVELLEACLPAPDQPRPVRWYSWRECFVDGLDVDALQADTGRLAALADDAPDGLDRDALLDWLFATRIQSDFPANAITVVHAYPASQAALARLSPDDDRIAERFEVFLGSNELANGYHELCDAKEQRRRFERDNLRRQTLGLEPMPVDENLLAALEAGLPDCSGVALGFDRLLMAATGSPSIDRTVPFAHRR